MGERGEMKREEGGRGGIYMHTHDMHIHYIKIMNGNRSSPLPLPPGSVALDNTFQRYSVLMVNRNSRPYKDTLYHSLFPGSPTLHR